MMGFALAYGHLALLRRAGNRARTHASLLATTLAVWGTMAFLLVRPYLMGRHSFVLIAACAVSLVALGGVVVIHEPVDSPRTRRRRLAAVFVSVALLIGLLPAAGRQWSLQADQRYRTARPSPDSGRRVAASAEPDIASVAP